MTQQDDREQTRAYADSVVQAVVQAVDVGLIAVDGTGRYTLLNPTVERMLALAYPDGRPEDSGVLAGQLYTDDGATPLAPEEYPGLAGAAGVEFTDRRIWIGRDPETRRALSLSMRQFSDETGRPAGAVVAAHDITALLQAQRAQEEFVASVSHELRSPLTSIAGYLELIEDERDRLPEDVGAHLEVIGRNTERLTRLVEQVLCVASQEAGLLVVPELVDVTSLVRAVLEARADQLEDAGLSLDDTLGETPAYVDGDPELLAQLVDQLLSNAVKFTQPGGRVGVVLRACEQHVVLEVADTGVGICEADQRRVFARFFRAAAAHEQALPGVGLGLAIARGVAEAHDGWIGVRSEPGRGSVFTVTLPAHRPH